jgi:hypothetical protein
LNGEIVVHRFEIGDILVLKKNIHVEAKNGKFGSLALMSVYSVLAVVEK